MTEIYVGTSQYAYFDLYNTSATGTPTATLTRNGTPSSLSVTEVLAPPDGVTERWRAYIPLSETTIPGEFTITWTAVAGAENVSKIDYFEVVTPYATPEELAARYGWSFDPVDSNYRPRADVVAAERIARWTINSFTRKYYGPQVKAVDAYGQNTDVLVLPEPVVAVDELYENGDLVIDGADFTKFGYAVEITDTGMAIRIISPDFYDLSESESLRITGPSGRFKQGYRYTIVGTFGSSRVPQVINDCTGMLVNDYMCKDALWRARYINHVEIRDWKFNFEKEAFRGTGNLIVDRLLNDERSLGIFVI